MGQAVEEALHARRDAGRDEIASADGYELTFAVNYLAHAQLIGDLLDSFASPARIVLVGSNTYYAHELQRRAPEGINVAVFEPGFMPGTGLGRQHGPGVQRVARVVQRLPIPGIASPVTSGPGLASVALDERWAHLRDGDFVLIDRERDVMPIANDPDRERRLWDATAELLRSTIRAGS